MNDDISSPIPFTARLMAYYRMQELQSHNPLIIDPLAKLMVDDELIEYVENHKYVAGNKDYSIIRSLFIEKEIIEKWLSAKETSQIVFLGAGLDTRAYRLNKLKEKIVSIYEIDFEEVIHFKNKILKQEKPLCQLMRIGTDLSKENWINDILSSGFKTELPTLWILEGLVYYIEKEKISKLLLDISNFSPVNSEIFADVCIPTLAELDFGPFTSNFKWGLDKKDIKSFFNQFGWKINFSLAEKHAFGREVGQGGLMFVHGSNTKVFQELDNTYDKVSKKNFYISDFKELTSNITNFLPLLEKISNSTIQDYLKIMKESISLVTNLVNEFDPLEVGQLVPRLLRDPFSVDLQSNTLSKEEIHSTITGYFESMLLLIICFLEKLQPWEFKESLFYLDYLQKRSKNRIETIKHLCKSISSY
jgi:methyltransferase (TIGR00027 family)